MASTQITKSSGERGSPNAAVFLRYDQLAASPLNPRQHARSDKDLADLAASIDSKGMLQNIVVRPAKGDSDGVYEIAAGEGRWRAVGVLLEQGKAGPDYKLPAVVRELSDEDVIEIGLVENTHRWDLHPLDEARAYHALYEKRVKKGGGSRKAQAAAVESIAKKINRTARYVQKRIKLARDLIPRWQALLDDGVLSLHQAQMLSTASKRHQEELLDQCDHRHTGQVDPEEVRKLTARDISREWRDMRGALFDPHTYTGDVEEIEGELYATDAKAFDKRQKEEAAKLSKQYRAQAKAGEIAFFETVTNFHPHLYEPQKEGGEPDPSGGVVLVKSWTGAYAVHRGLFKTEHTKKAEAEKKAREATRAKQRRKEAEARADKVAKGVVEEPTPEDPRPAAVEKYLRANPRALIAVELYNALCGWRSADSVRFGEFGTVQMGDEDIRAELRKGLKANEKLPTGSKLLDWLLAAKLEVLAGAYAIAMFQDYGFEVDLIEKPNAAETALFKLAKAELPPELQPKPKAAKDPKAKPAAKKKGAPKGKAKPKGAKNKKKK